MCCGPVAGGLFVFISVTCYTSFGFDFFFFLSSSAYLLRLTGTRCRLAGDPANFHSEALWLRQRQAKAGSGAAEAKIGCPPSLHLLPTCPQPRHPVVLNHLPSHHSPAAPPPPRRPSVTRHPLHTLVHLLIALSALPRSALALYPLTPPSKHTLLAYIVVLDPSVAPF